VEVDQRKDSPDKLFPLEFAELQKRSSRPKVTIAICIAAGT
jgi:hypothetical protein